MKLLECKVGFTAKPSQKRFKGIKIWEDCRDKCNDEECSHFSYKVIDRQAKTKIHNKS